MGKLDDEMYSYLSDGETFADLVNAGCFGGKQIVNGKRLERMSERVQAEKIVCGKRHRKTRGQKKKEGMDRTEGIKHREEFPQLKNYYRDLRMKLPDGTMFKILAAENQSSVDYEMPLRIMMRDGAEYEEQLKNLHQKKRNAREGKKNPLLEKMDEKDRLCPVYTICFYHGEGKWTGPNSIKDMMDFGEDSEQSKMWEKIFCDYPIIVLNAEDENLSGKCKTELRQFLQAMQARKEPKKLEELFLLDEYNHLSYESARAIAIMTGMAEYLENMEEYKTQEGDRYRMCTAIREIRNESREQGREEGREEGRELTMLDNLKSLMKNMNVSAQKAMEILNVPMEERESYQKKMGVF